MDAQRTVLVGTDGSASSFTAVERAARLAADTRADLVIVCAYQPLSGPELVRAQEELGEEAYQVVGSAPAEESLRAARARAEAQGAAHVQLRAVEGDPVTVLVRVARECSADLLVVGNRGLRSLAGRLLGSVPADVARKAGVDVLIVHTT
ncbi:universal stress protein [Streptomyces sp. ZEA17I]|uniref:universal stress protein n=1 Tax=Streptomyces sp. ZEA17I TaxID=2202516 RepID=UPI000D6EBB70|nr:universal stress protein [Streptomyces sp. ZEA17I]PWS42356.1 universal stress protein [Streptomyces sp. ZEA17I]